MMAGCDARCSERIHDAAAQSSDVDCRADRGASFKPVRGTLNCSPFSAGPDQA